MYFNLCHKNNPNMRVNIKGCTEVDQFTPDKHVYVYEALILKKSSVK